MRAQKKADPPRPVVELSGRPVRPHPAGHELSMPVEKIHPNGTPRDMRHLFRTWEPNQWLSPILKPTRQAAPG